MNSRDSEMLPCGTPFDIILKSFVKTSAEESDREEFSSYSAKLQSLAPVEYPLIQSDQLSKLSWKRKTIARAY